MRPVALRTPAWGCARAPWTGTQASGSRARTYLLHLVLQDSRGFSRALYFISSLGILHLTCTNPLSAGWVPFSSVRMLWMVGRGCAAPPGGLFAVGAGSVGGKGHVAPGPFPPLHLQLLFTRGSRRLASHPSFCGQLSPSSGGGHLLWSLSTPGAHQWIRDPPTELRGATGSLISIKGQALAMPTSFHLPSWREASQRNVEGILFNYILIHFQVSQAVQN